MSATATASRQPAAGLTGWCRANLHFLIASALMLLTTIGWNSTVRAMKWVTHKEPVPWPAGVRVDDNSRLVSLADRIGSFVLLGDGEMPGGNGKLDGQPDGEVILPQDVLESLGMNTSADRQRLAQRCSNWYVSRLYRDSRPQAMAGRAFWQLDLTYYTGSLDTVPHVPERCLVAGGARLVSIDTVTIKPSVALPEPWNGDLRFTRTRYEIQDQLGLMSRQFVQYHVFSINGRPEADWKQVRLALTNPLVRYCYFAKIQIAPRFEVTDPAEADAGLQDFVDQVLPSALRLLPMPQDVRQLDAARAKASK